MAEPPTPYEGHQFSDYVLLGKDRKPLAVIEAKRTSREQAKQYCYNIQKQLRGQLPFCFYTNGHETYFWDLEKVCANDPAAHLVRYADIAATYKDLGEQLAVFFKGLYSRSLLDLAALRAKVGDIHDHYQTFVSTNTAGKRPFCGLGDIKGTHHSKREAYDHCLPKALYPFNSLNFRNLASACHDCNSIYKRSKDPAHNSAGRHMPR